MCAGAGALDVTNATLCYREMVMSMHHSSDMINMAVIQKNGVLDNLWLYMKLEVKRNYLSTIRKFN